MFAYYAKWIECFTDKFPLNNGQLLISYNALRAFESLNAELEHVALNSVDERQYPSLLNVMPPMLLFQLHCITMGVK